MAYSQRNARVTHSKKIKETFWAWANTIGYRQRHILVCIGLKISKIVCFWPNLGQKLQLIPGKPLEGLLPKKLGKLFGQGQTPKPYSWFDLKSLKI